MKPATEADVSGKLENLRRIMEQFTMQEDGESATEDIDKYMYEVRVYERHFEWLLNLIPMSAGNWMIPVLLFILRQ